MSQPELPDLLTPGEVAALFRVDPKTVTRWAAAWKLESIRTPGDHRRFPSNQKLIADVIAARARQNGAGS